MEQKVKDIICEELCIEADEIKNDSLLVDDLGAESLSIISIVSALENEFDIEIDYDEFKNIVKYEDIIKILSEKYAVA